jgi:hypothetical protein
LELDVRLFQIFINGSATVVGGTNSFSRQERKNIS